MKASFERKKAIDAVLSNIIRIRFAGIEERRALTKTFLEAQVEVSDEFKTEVAEYESRIAEYDKLNGLLLDHLDNHRALMERKIEESQAAEEEQRTSARRYRGRPGRQRNVNTNAVGRTHASSSETL